MSFDIMVYAPGITMKNGYYLMKILSCTVQTVNPLYVMFIYQIIPGMYPYQHASISLVSIPHASISHVSIPHASIPHVSLSSYH